MLLHFCKTIVGKDGLIDDEHLLIPLASDTLFRAHLTVKGFKNVAKSHRAYASFIV